MPITNSSNNFIVYYDDKLLNEEEAREICCEYGNDCNSSITKDNMDKAILYPMSKAICQAVLLPVPKIEIEEISYEELKAIPSKRGTGILGSSDK